MVALDSFDILAHGSDPETPRKRGDITRYIQVISREYDLDLPWKDNSSPSKRVKTPKHELTSNLKYLFFQDPTALDGVLQDFRAWFSTLKDQEDRVDILLQQLTIARSGSVKARSATANVTEDDRELPEPPPSPTQYIRNAPRSELPTERMDPSPPATRRNLHAALSKANNSGPLSKANQSGPVPVSKKNGSPSKAAARYGTSTGASPQRGHAGQHARLGNDTSLNVNAPTSASTLFAPEAARRSAYTSFAANVAPMTANTSFTSNAAPTNANTSFASNAGLTSMNTSFNSNLEPSFWSGVEQGTQDPASPATSVDSAGPDIFHEAKSRQSHDRLSHDLLNAEQSDTGRASTQFTDYGSEFEASQLDDSTLQPPAGLEENAMPGQSTSRNETGMGDVPFKPETEKSLIRPVHNLSGKARVDRIPLDGLSCLQLPPSCRTLSFDLQWEAMRLLQTKKISPEYLGTHWVQPRTFDSLHDLARTLTIRFSRGREMDASTSLAAQFRWTKASTGPIFELGLLQPRIGKSHALERRFGRDRFLILDVPALSKPPTVTGLDSGAQVIKQIKQLFRQRQFFLGRHWQQFHVKTKDPLPGDPDFAKQGAIQVYFFAVGSEPDQLHPLQPVAIARVLNWAVQFDENSTDPECKIFARLDLAVSRTIPTFEFKKHEIDYNVPDRMPTDDLDDTTFDDPDLPPNSQMKSGDPMDDGCNKISAWAMREISRMLDIDDDYGMPSAVQARVFGAKGMWYLDSGDEIRERPEKLITISKSQIKVRQREDSYFESEKMTLNVNSTSKPARASQLYLDFMKLLEAGKVPRSVVSATVKKSIEAMTQSFLNAFDDPHLMYRWIHAHNASRDKKNREMGNIEEIGGYPVSREDRIKFVLESGFEPKTCKYLAEELCLAAKQAFDLIMKQIKVELPNSTMLLGIVDNKGCVEAGEVHIGFSSRFRDSDQSRLSLRGLDVLIARQPALGRSDMQKVRCVFKPELAHLVDVIAFSAKGPRSEASKLQGGDHDGDTFWICWEQPLVQPFRNAPVQEVRHTPDGFGIVVKKQALAEVVPVYFAPNAIREEDVLDWIANNTAIRMQGNLLGVITNMYEALVYHENSLESPRAHALLELHDYMIDSDKRGYHFDYESWNTFKRKWGLTKGLATPAYKQYMKEGEMPPKWKADSIIDHIFFEIMEPNIRDALVKAGNYTKQEVAGDEHVVKYFVNIWESYPEGSTALQELRALRRASSELKAKWNRYTSEYYLKKDRPGGAWKLCLEQIRADWEAIAPNDPSSDTARAWTDRNGSAPTTWELLKASAVVVEKASSKMMFAVAGREICDIKVHATGSSRAMRKSMYLAMKPRSQKRKAEDDGGDEDGLGVAVLNA